MIGCHCNCVDARSDMCVLPQLCAQLGLDTKALTGPLPVHMAASVTVLLAPGLAAWALDVAGRWAPTLAMPWQALPAPQAAPAGAGAATAGGGGVSAAGSGRAPGPAVGFLEMAYGYLPLVWAATLAHYLLLFCEEAGRILPVRCRQEILVARGRGHNSIKQQQRVTLRSHLTILLNVVSLCFMRHCPRARPRTC